MDTGPSWLIFVGVYHGEADCWGPHTECRFGWAPGNCLLPIKTVSCFSVKHWFLSACFQGILHMALGWNKRLMKLSLLGVPQGWALGPAPYTTGGSCKGDRVSCHDAFASGYTSATMVVTQACLRSFQSSSLGTMLFPAFVWWCLTVCCTVLFY